MGEKLEDHTGPGDSETVDPVGLLYFAGHSIQVDGVGYLVRCGTRMREVLLFAAVFAPRA